MARSKNNNYAVPQAKGALQQFKYEIANEVGLGQAYQAGDLGNLSSRQNGTVGGFMTKRMIELAQQNMAQNSNIPPMSQNVNNQPTGGGR